MRLRRSDPEWNLLLLALGLAVAAPVLARDEAAPPSVLEYTLEELAELRVETASRTSEPLDLTPATVYVVTAEDIRTYGYRNLADVLDNVPGVTGINIGFHLFGGQRGLPGNFSQTLLLINGREVQNLVANEAFIGDQFATDNIRQIEIMNSPGSALYGANAYSGVINILTRDADPKFTGQQARLEYGSEDTRALSLVSATQTENGRASLYFRQYRSDNWDFGDFVGDRERFSAGFPAVAQEASARAGAEYHNAGEARAWAARFDKAGFYLGTDGYRLQTRHGLEAVQLDYQSSLDIREFELWYGGWRGPAWGGELTAEYQFRRERLWGTFYFFDEVIWQGLLAGGRDPNAPLTEEEISRHFALHVSQENSPGSQRHQAYVQFQKPFGTAQLTVGVVGRHSDLRSVTTSTTDPSPPFDDQVSDANPSRRPFYRSRNEAIYAQWRDSLFNTRLDITLGARLDHHSQYGTVDTFRSGLVFHHTPTTHWRLLYGEAFREPNIFELGAFNIPGQPGNVNVQPATITTTELGLVQQISDNQRLQVTAFDNRIKSLLRPTGTFSFVNVEQERVQGVEAQYDYRQGRWRWDAGYTWMRPDDTGVAGQPVESLNVYEHRLSLGAAFLPAPDWRLALRANYFDELDAEHGNPAVEQVIHIPSALRLDAQLRWLPSLLQPDDAEIALGIRNLTDTQYYQPSVRNGGPRQFLQPGRQYLLSFTLRY